MKYSIVFLMIVLAACYSSVSRGMAPQAKSQKVQGGVIREVLQTNSYTYLNVKSGKEVQWLAVPANKFAVGDSCYFMGGLVMPDFTSKELNRKFDKVIFLESVSKTREMAKAAPTGMPEHAGRSKPAKLEKKISPAPGGITIAELYKNKDKYSGKVVRIRGEVVKFKTKILGKNWVHLQDGSAYGEKFDLTCTTASTTNVGSVVTFEGKVTLNKDFGSGYFFEVIMEDASQK